MSKIQKRKFVFSLILFIFLMGSTIFVLLKGESYDTIQNIIFLAAVLTAFLVFVMDIIIDE